MKRQAREKFDLTEEFYYDRLVNGRVERSPGPVPILCVGLPLRETANEHTINEAIAQLKTLWTFIAADVDTAFPPIDLRAPDSSWCSVL